MEMKTLLFYVLAMSIAWLCALGFMINIILNEATFSIAFVGLIFTSIFFSAQTITKIDRILKVH